MLFFAIRAPLSLTLWHFTSMFCPLQRMHNAGHANRDLSRFLHFALCPLQCTPGKPVFFVISAHILRLAKCHPQTSLLFLELPDFHVLSIASYLSPYFAPCKVSPFAPCKVILVHPHISMLCPVQSVTPKCVAPDTRTVHQFIRDWSNVKQIITPKFPCFALCKLSQPVFCPLQSYLSPYLAPCKVSPPRTELEASFVLERKSALFRAAPHTLNEIINY